jgi:hypothetical protein
MELSNLRTPREKNRDILHFLQCLGATDGTETRIEAQECGHWFIQPSDPKGHSTVIARIDDVIAVVPDCGACCAWQTHIVASSSGDKECRMSLLFSSVVSYAHTVPLFVAPESFEIERQLPMMLH